MPASAWIPEQRSGCKLMTRRLTLRRRQPCWASRMHRIGKTSPLGPYEDIHARRQGGAYETNHVFAEIRMKCPTESAKPGCTPAKWGADYAQQRRRNSESVLKGSPRQKPTSLTPEVALSRGRLWSGTSARRHHTTTVVMPQCVCALTPDGYLAAM